MTEADPLCPFAKAIIGQWCQCPHAGLAERCSGKMVCARPDDYLSSCRHLDQLLRDKARFILGIGKLETTLTHAQLMKVRCGGLEGMARWLQLPSPPAVLDVIAAAERRFGVLEAFPFNEIVAHIQGFSHRRKQRS